LAGSRQPREPGYWHGRGVLVAGGTGFLGGWLIAELLRRGALVTAIVRQPRPRSQFELAGLAGRVTVIAGSASDPAGIAAAFAGRQIDAVFQLASLVDVHAALRDPAAALRSSIDSTLAVLEHVRLHRPDAIVVVASSDKAYGAQPTPFREDQPLRPGHPYEIAKATQDQLAQAYGKLYGLKVGITRCGNYFGGWDFAFERIIPYTIRQLLSGLAPVLRSDGKYTRDFLYIEEAVRAHLLLAERLAAAPELAGEAFNFSHEVEITIIELVETIAARLGSPLKPIVAADAKAEILHLRLDTAKARKILDWHPQTDFAAGLGRTVDWYREHRALLPAV
jgi:CDP-glucose 4,6-dehydratase